MCRKGLGLRSGSVGPSVRVDGHMRSTGKKLIRGVSCCVALSITVLILFVMSPSFRLFVSIPVDIVHSARIRKNLPDYPHLDLLLKECRMLVAEYPGESIEAGDKRLGWVFGDVGAQYVVTEHDHALVVLHGGFDHYGLLAYAEGVEGYGTRKLIDGLWFYDAE